MTNDPAAPSPRMRLIALLLLVLVLACAAGALAAGRTDKPAEEDLIARGYKFAGEKPDDKFNEIPGDETTIRVYRKGQESVALYILPNGLIYGYAVKDGAKPILAYIDEYNTGYCDKDVSAGENFMIDLRAYGMSGSIGPRRRR